MEETGWYYSLSTRHVPSTPASPDCCVCPDRNGSTGQWRRSLDRYPHLDHRGRDARCVELLLLCFSLVQGESGSYPSDREEHLLTFSSPRQQAHQFARADYAVSRRAQHARLGLRFFAESILFTFLPATVIQIAWLLVASLSLRLPDPDGKLARADSYLRMLNSSFSVNFGLLAVWWATARIHAQNVGGTGSTQQKSDGDGKRNALDMSMINWALGPLEPERRTSGTSRILKQSSPAGRVHPVSRVDEVKSGGDQVEEIKSLPTEQEEGQEEDSDSRRRKATNGI